MPPDENDGSTAPCTHPENHKWERQLIAPQVVVPSHHRAAG